ncbi:hypothetical protein [Falsibacillus pallidus]|uniref:Uncharacterized protein n=1 Tax=Falsibacillus pallidus TaxID=493781 RepID=A0A370GPE4_9BACI|nr:hypothetical protein [Falsibacillus pallidus]RDI45598.1 hypothetical protein DFR59_102227 [Falsibacillus pallidus]
MIVPVIEEVVEAYREFYGVHFPIEVNLIIGGFGSNAYTYRQVIPNISFALERLSSNSEHLKVIAAHEFGHAAHNILSDQAGMNWRELKWASPLTWFIQEGAAIHFSRIIAAGLYPSVYFHFNDEGDEWLSFAESNKEMIKNRFFEDYKKESASNLFLEWFSIRGGKTFGYDRLGYFLADMFFQNLIQSKGELEAVTAWKEKDFEDMVLNWMEN